MASRRRGRYTPTLVLAGGVLVAAGLAVWSRRQVPDSVHDERRGKLLPSLRRDRIDRVEIVQGATRFALYKQQGRWHIDDGHGTRRDADDTEVERLLTDAEFAEPVRRLGPLDRSARERFGLTAPRARVTMHEADGATLQFAIGGQVAEAPDVYVETAGEGFVAARSMGDLFVAPSSELRQRALSDLEPTRTRALVFDGEGGHRVIEHVAPVWRFVAPPEGRVDRARMESLLNDLRDLRATRFLTDDADAATLARNGLSPPRLTVHASRDRGAADLSWRFGGTCDGREDEVVIARGDGNALACTGRAVLENLLRPTDAMRDDHLVWARPDEVERITLHGPSGDLVLHRAGEAWRIDGAASVPDADSVDAWLTLLAGLVVETRLDASTAASHGLEPVTQRIELARTGVDGVERLDLGTPDADRMYARRDGERAVLGLDPGTTETLRADASRFRSRHVIRDVPDEMTALVTVTPSFRDEVTNAAGWRVVRPLTADADPGAIRLAASRLATLDAERWVALAPVPAYGFATPRLHVTARFEGTPPDPEGGDAGAPDASAASRVREYDVTVGAAATGGGFYAMLAGHTGVFVLAQAALDEIAQPHVDHALLTFDASRIDRIEITRPRVAGGAEHLVLARDAGVWHTAAGASADRARIEALLARLADLRAPRVVGYGPAAADTALGSTALTVRESAGLDGGAARTIRVLFGASVGGAESAAVYARRDGLDATLSAPRDAVDALRDFAP